MTRKRVAIGYKLQEIDMATDAERLDWLEKKFFNPKEDQDEGWMRWYLTPDYKSILTSLRGDSLREAIDKKINGDTSKTI